MANSNQIATTSTATLTEDQKEEMRIQMRKGYTVLRNVLTSFTPEGKKINLVPASLGTAATDGNNVYLPSKLIFQCGSSDPDARTRALGFIIHECCHLWFTDMDKTNKTLQGWLDDARSFLTNLVSGGNVLDPVQDKDFIDAISDKAMLDKIIKRLAVNIRHVHNFTEDRIIEKKFIALQKAANAKRVLKKLNNDFLLDGDFENFKLMLERQNAMQLYVTAFNVFMSYYIGYITESDKDQYEKLMLEEVHDREQTTLTSVCLKFPFKIGYCQNLAENICDRLTADNADCFDGWDCSYVFNSGAWDNYSSLYFLVDMWLRELQPKKQQPKLDSSEQGDSSDGDGKSDSEDNNQDDNNSSEEEQTSDDTDDSDEDESDADEDNSEEDDSDDSDDSDEDELDDEDDSDGDDIDEDNSVDTNIGTEDELSDKEAEAEDEDNTFGQTLKSLEELQEELEDEYSDEEENVLDNEANVLSLTDKISICNKKITLRKGGFSDYEKEVLRCTHVIEKHPNASREKWWKRYLKDNASEIARLSGAIKKELMGYTRKNYTQSAEKGRRVAKSALAKIAQGLAVKQPFSAQGKSETMSTHIVLLCDVSGSMDCPSKENALKKGLAMLAGSLGRIESTNLKFSVYTFSHKVFSIKSVNEKLTPKALSKVEINGSTEGYLACIHAAKELHESKMQRKICIVLTDGEFDYVRNFNGLNPNREDLYGFMDGIETYGVLVETNSCELQYNDAVFVNNANDMPNALQNLFVKILGGNKQINKRLAS